MRQHTTRSAARTATLVALPATLIAGVLTFWLLGGFRAGPDGAGASAAARPSAPARPQSSAPVPVPAPALSAEQATACRALVAKLPAVLDALPRRPVTQGAEQNAAAYGDPPVTLTCGAPPVPAGVTDQPFELAGVCWYPQRRADATVWTTLDRQIPVAVTVPASYQPPAQWVIDFSAPVLATIPPAPTRCR
jgi:Protein of unknown function (DUF3515)